MFENAIALLTRIAVALEAIAAGGGLASSTAGAAAAADTTTKANKPAAGKAAGKPAAPSKPSTTLEDAKGALAELKAHIDSAGDKGIVHVRKVLQETAGVEKSAELPDDAALYAKVVKAAEAELAAYKTAQAAGNEEEV